MLNFKVGRISDDHSLEVSAKDGVVSIHGAAADAYQVSFSEFFRRLIMCSKPWYRY